MDLNQPLAHRVRPKTLEEFFGQEHILGKDKLLYRAISADKLSSLIFYGPPGTGKTTLAKVIANHPEMFPDAIRATIETGEEIDADVFADIIEDIEEFELIEPEVEETEEEEADSYISLFD